MANILNPEYYNDGEGFFNVDKMISHLAFFTTTYDELKKVVWPTREQLIRLTLIVIVISVIVGAYIGGIDLALTKLTEVLVK